MKGNSKLLWAKNLKRERDENASLSRSVGMLKVKLKTVQEEASQLRIDLEKSREKTPSVDDCSNAIISDLIKHGSGDTESEYSVETINLAIQIKSISPKAYSILSQYLPFPSANHVEYLYKKSIEGIPEMLTDSERLNELVDMWKDSNRISKSENISACLSVDAIFFKPEAKITVRDCITGTAFSEDLKEKLPDNPFKFFTKNPGDLDKFVNLNWDKIVKAGFVFQIQPYNIKYKPFVIHIKPTANGKANEEIVNLLHEIRDTVKNRRINVKTFAFDGDSAYRQLHFMYYDSYIHKVLKSNDLKGNNTRKIRIVSDYLHILKRLRYRLLSSIIHSGFKGDTPILDLEVIRETLDEMGDVVWCNDLFTKMHDSLPLELFKTENFCKLLETENYEAMAFWFPITLSNIAINQPNIGFEYREFLLKSAFFFLVYYAECWENSDCELRQKKYADSLDVTFYTKELLIEFTNTLHAHIQLMSTEEDYCFNRNSTTPLEHKFGFVRARSRDVNTLSKFLKIISTIQSDAISIVNHVNEEADKIRGRSFPQSVVVEERISESDDFVIQTEDSIDDDLPFSPQTVALSALLLAGFEVEASESIDPEDVMDWLVYLLSFFVDEEKSKGKSSISLNTFKYGTENLSKSKKLITGSPNPNNKKLNKFEFKEQLFNEVYFYITGEENVTKRGMLTLLEIIKSKDPKCIKPPKQTDSKQKIYEWLIVNMSSYYVLLKNC